MPAMKPETIAAKLAEIVGARKVLESEIAEKEAKYTDELEAANEVVAAIVAKINRATEAKRAQLDEAKDLEKGYRAKLLDVDLLDATFTTAFGTVQIQRQPTPVVKRFASVPVEFRKDPDKCIETVKIRKAFKDGQKVPGIDMVDFPKVVVR